MVTTIGTAGTADTVGTTLVPRLRAMIVVGLLALSLLVGAGATPNRVGAAALHGAPGGSASSVPDNGQLARKKQTYCRVIPYPDWNLMYPNDPSDVGGMYCWKA